MGRLTHFTQGGGGVRQPPSRASLVEVNQAILAWSCTGIVDSAAIYNMVVKFTVEILFAPLHRSSPFIGGLRCQAFQTEQGPSIAERTQKAVYIVRCLCCCLAILPLLQYSLKLSWNRNFFSFFLSCGASFQSLTTLVLQQRL
jgi:hypothetical protein